MQVHDEILKCVVFLGVPTERKTFTALGTGFLVSVNEGEKEFVYVATCRHLITSTGSDPNSGSVWLRVNRKEEPPLPVKTSKSDWTGHEDRKIDICVTPFDVAKLDAAHTLDVGILDSSKIIMSPDVQRRFGLGIGDQVFIVGLFAGRAGDSKNIPIVRMANIAAMPVEAVWPSSQRRPAYLIETRSLGGISGSPIFLHTAPERIPGGPRIWNDPTTGNITMPYFLIGMVQGSHGGRYASEFVADDEDEGGVVAADATFNAGISVALPISQVMEVINQPKLRQQREAAPPVPMDKR